MKILHVIRSVDPAAGGPIEGVRQLGTTNMSFGHHVEVASLDAPDAPFINSCKFPLHPLGPARLNYGYSSRILPWLRENARKYDVVIVNGIWQYHSFAVRQALYGGSTPYVVYTHGMLDPWFKYKYPMKHLKKLLYWPWGDYRVLRDASAVFFTCEEERILARQSFGLYRCNEVVVKYGTAGPLGAPEAELGRFYKVYPQLLGKRLALFLGRLHEKKGCDLLIEAFARTLAAEPEWHLVICGPDQVKWQTQLQALAERRGIKDRITWTGMVQGALKWGALRAAEIFVLPSHQENFGIAVAEALACGTPVLISDKVNIWREVQGAQAGIVAADDLDGTCTLLRRWLAMSPAQRLQMRQCARRCFLGDFEINAASQTLIHSLSDIIEGKAMHAGA